MYYKCRAIRLKKNGKISVTVAENNVSPLRYFTTDYRGTLADLLESIQEGNIHLGITKANQPFISLSNAIDKVGKAFDKEGLTWEIEFRYKLGDRNLGIRRACEMYANAYINENRDVVEFGRELNKMLSEFIEKGKQNLEAAKENDRKEGIVRIRSASYSIFQGELGDYDLLIPEEGDEDFILAPSKDYNNGGVLKTAPENIIKFGSGYDSIRAFLTYSGVNVSMEEYIEKCPTKEAVIRHRFDVIDKAIERAESYGLTIKLGISPYIGYRKAT